MVAVVVVMGEDAVRWWVQDGDSHVCSVRLLRTSKRYPLTVPGFCKTSVGPPRLFSFLSSIKHIVDLVFSIENYTVNMDVIGLKVMF